MEVLSVSKENLKLKFLLETLLLLRLTVELYIRK